MKMKLSIASCSVFLVGTYNNIGRSNAFGVVGGFGGRSMTTRLSGSIYGNAAGEDEDGAERDHLGMKKPKSGAKSTKKEEGDASAEVVVEAKKISVKFINFESIGGQERVVEVDQESNILKVAREQNVKIPYNCRTGLCGSCTADVKDPTWDEGDRPGFQTVRTCQAGAMLPAGCDEMVIDCYRMVSADVEITAGDNTGTNPTVSSSPMSNFEEGWEDDFSPDYKKTGEVRVARKLTPEYAVRQGRRSAIEIEKPHWTPTVDANVAPWETIW